MSDHFGPAGGHSWHRVRGRPVVVGRLAGVPVTVTFAWLVSVVVLAWALGSTTFRERLPDSGAAAGYALGLLSAMLLFTSVLVHEAGHLFVARRRGLEAIRIELWPLGGIVRLRDDHAGTRDELHYAAGGPAATALLTVGLALLSRLFAPGSVVRVVIDVQVLANASLLAFNVLPAYPLDGGRALRALLRRSGDDLDRATAASAMIGCGVGTSLAVGAAIASLLGASGLLWLGLAGVMLGLAAATEVVRARIRSAWRGTAVSEVMSEPAITIPEQLTVAQAVDDFFGPYRLSAFPVVAANGTTVGLLRIAAVEQLSAGQRGTMAVGELADRDPEVLVAPDTAVTALLDAPGFLRGGYAVIIDVNGSSVGVVSVTDLDHSLRALRLAQRTPQRTRIA